MPDEDRILRLLGLVGNGDADLRSLVERHSILLGKLINEVGSGNILYGLEAPVTDVAAHASSSSAHHVKYSDAAAVSAVEVDGLAKQEVYIPFGNEPEAGVTIFPS